MEDKAVCINENNIDTTIICTTDFNPVCACNNKTYKNACEAENIAGISLYSPGQCEHICTYNDTLMVIATDTNCTLLSDFNTFYEVDYAPEGTIWEKEKYYLVNSLLSENTPNCGGSESIHILCSILHDQSCIDLIASEGIDTQLPNDSVQINQFSITNNCITIDYSFLGGCDDTRLSLHHLIDSTTTELTRLQLRFDNGNGPCTDTVNEFTSFNLTSLRQESQNSVAISIDCSGDNNFNELLNYVY
tara:strand:+ start:312 stop:1052 length:741 start_codon:yes stop_codon:yes gene_type:complete